MNPLETAIKLLKPSEIHPSKIINMDKEGEERLIGLSVQCNPLHAQETVAKIRKIVGDGYAVNWLPNAQEIVIETKAP